MIKEFIIGASKMIGIVIGSLIALILYMTAILLIVRWFGGSKDDAVLAVFVVFGIIVLGTIGGMSRIDEARRKGRI